MHGATGSTREDCHFGSHRHGIILSPSHRRPNAYRCLPKVRAGPVGKYGGSAYQARRWQCGTLRICRANLCVCCVRRGVRRSGGVVGHLRRPCQPLQVIGVLAEVLPIARRFLLFNPFFRARRQAASTALDRSRRAGRTSARQYGADPTGCCERGSPLH